jgi:hypothetical protein
LLHLSWVADANGTKFKVGSVSIKKFERRLTRQVEAAIKAAKLANLDERIAAAQARLAADPEFLTDKPSYWRRYDGKLGNQTLREKVEFLFANGGVKGRTDACEIVEGYA